MKNYTKKIVITTVLLTLLTPFITGCTLVDGWSVAKINGKRVSYGEASFFVRYNQSTYEEFYPQYGYDPDTMWSTSQGDDTLEQSTKKQFKKDLTELYILDQHKDDYKLALTNDEAESIKKTAENIISANSKKELNKIHATKSNIIKILKLLTVKEKLKALIVKDVNTDVTDEEAAQKRMYYATFEFEESKTDEASEEESDSSSADTSSKEQEDDEEDKKDTKDEAKTKAENYLSSMKAKNPTKDNFVDLAKEYEVDATEMLFDKEDEAPSKAVVEAADKLKSGEYTTVEDGTNIYAVYLMSDFDREGTDSNKETIVNERKNDEYEKVYKKWKKESKVKYNFLWKMISLDNLGLKKPETTEDEPVQPTSEEPAEEVTEDTSSSETTDTETQNTEASSTE